MFSLLLFGILMQHHTIYNNQNRSTLISTWTPISPLNLVSKCNWITRDSLTVRLYCDLLVPLTHLIPTSSDDFKKEMYLILMLCRQRNKLTPLNDYPFLYGGFSTVQYTVDLWETLMFQLLINSTNSKYCNYSLFHTATHSAAQPSAQ